MNRAIAGAKTPLSRRITNTAVTTATQPPRRIGPRPVATIGDPAMAGEDRQPEQRHDREPDRETDQQRADEPGGRVDAGRAS